MKKFFFKEKNKQQAAGTEDNEIIDQNIDISNKSNKNQLGKIDIVKRKVSKLSQNNSIKQKSEFEQKVDKNIESMKQLLAPFEELMLKVVPVSKWVINPIKFLSLFILAITRLIILRFPAFIKFIKSKYFGFLILILITLFLFGAIFSNIINSNRYTNALQNSIYEETGYRAEINGRIRVALIPKVVLQVNNISFFINNSLNQSIERFKINNFNASRVEVIFKFLPLLWGSFDVKHIIVNGGVIDIQTLGSQYESNTSYEELITQIETSINNSEMLVEDKNSDLFVEEENLNNYVDDQQDLNEENSHNVQSDINESTSPVQEESLGPLISPKRLNNDDPNNLISYIVLKVVRNMNLDLKKMDTLILKRSKMNFSNNNQRLFVLDNLTTRLYRDSRDHFIAEGGFNFANNNISYSANLDYKDQKTNFTIDFSLLENKYDNIHITGFKDSDKNNITADITVNNNSLFTILNEFMFDLDLSKIQTNTLSAKLFINSDIFKLYDVNLRLNEQLYKGSFAWDIATNNDVVIDIVTNNNTIMEMYDSMNTYISARETNNVKFLSIVNSIIDWKNTNISFFRTSNFVVNVSSDMEKLDKKINPVTNMSFIIHNFNYFYLTDFTIKNNRYDISTIGKIDLRTKEGALLLNTKGSIDGLLNDFQLKPQMIKFLKEFSQNNDTYDLSSKLNLSSNKIIFTDILGNIGSFSPKSAYAILTQNRNNNEIFLSINSQFFDLNELLSIYKNQVDNIVINEDGVEDIFGIPTNIDVAVNLSANKSIFYDLPLEDLTMEVSLGETGFNISRLVANSTQGGSIRAFIRLDSMVSPLVVGQVNFNNTVVHFEDLSNMFFSSINLVGNVVVNGDIRFNLLDYNDYFPNINGELNLIKKERIESNMIENIDGLFLTLTKRQSNGEDKIFVNDIYGKVSIKDSQIDLYPVSFLYRYNNQDYRGVSNVLISLSNLGAINSEGDGVMLSDTTNKMEFVISNTLKKPEIEVSLYQEEGEPTAIILPEEQEENLVDTITEESESNRFQNEYNYNIDNESFEELSDQLYQESIERNQ